jgi:flavin reductase (DIM6/NTAB) family NADH-FMN oxidoreductase RutF
MLQKIDPKTLTMNPFTLIGDQWMLITAGTPEHCNTMTASWGGVGVMWAEPSATCYIRPQRYTKEFVDSNDYFTLCFFDESYRKALNLCGSTSGRDVDKIKECGFNVQAGAGNAPYFAEAELVLVCKKRYVQPMKPECFVDETIDEKFYPQKDYHVMYIGQIVEAYQKG